MRAEKRTSSDLIRVLLTSISGLTIGSQFGGDRLDLSIYPDGSVTVRERRQHGKVWRRWQFGADGQWYGPRQGSPPNHHQSIEAAVRALAIEGRLSGELLAAGLASRSDGAAVEKEAK